MSKTTLLLALAALPLAAQDKLAAQLDEVARIATVMVDGDVCQRIVTKQSLAEMFAENPRDKWGASDNYTVDHNAYILTKKTLQRLARLAPGAVDVNLWMPITQKPGKMHVVIRNQNEMSQFWPWGALFQDMPATWKPVLEQGKRLTVREKPGWISVLAPVYNSLGDAVGLVEVVTNTSGDTHQNVK
ncbi:MAG: hypothetical protein U0Q16_26840 [Bryobacteraceae bacterium]